MLFLVINSLSNLEFRRRRKGVQVVQIGGGNLDKISKKSSFFLGGKRIFREGKEQHYLENETDDILKNEKLLAMDGRMDKHQN